MLIYAFRDARGTWYGDPDAAIHDTRPGRGVVSLSPTVPGQDPGPFDGQQIEVLYAACDREASQTSYRLDNGVSYAATRHVHALLSPTRHRPLTARTAVPGAATRSVKLETRTQDRIYSFHADLLAEGRAEITVVVCTPDGVMQGQLTGEMDVRDLDQAGRLITSASTASAVDPAFSATTATPAKATRRDAGRARVPIRCQATWGPAPAVSAGRKRTRRCRGRR